jgi:hypothetical protein
VLALCEALCHYHSRHNRWPQTGRPQGCDLLGGCDSRQGESGDTAGVEDQQGQRGVPLVSPARTRSART